LAIYGLSRVKIKKKSQLVSELGLENADKLVGDLPLGWKQKLSVGFVHEPKIVFLDRTNWWRRSHYERDNSGK
jgi:ABC-2 type transport system ATP-binding protein